MKLLIAALFFSFVLIFPIKILAHAGGGPPFVSVNGELAQTNPYYQGTASINVPQDILKKKFLPNEQITLTVDPSKLPIPTDVIGSSEFSWIFFNGENFMTQLGTGQTGLSITQKFPTPGSYLVNVYLTYQNDPQLLDTIQLDVLPRKDYVPPVGKVQITQDDNTATFRTTPVLDNTTTLKKSVFDIGDGKITTGTSITHTYETSSFVSFVYNRIIDSNNLISDVGFQSQGITGKISFVPFTNAITSPFSLSPTSAPWSFPLWMKISLVLFWVIVGGAIFLRYKIKRVK